MADAVDAEQPLLSTERTRGVVCVRWAFGVVLAFCSVLVFASWWLMPKGTLKPFWSESPVALHAQAPHPKVRIELYGMAGCPYTRGFIEGPLAETLQTLSEYIDFHLFPFGNSYYATRDCGGAVEPSTFPFASYFQGYNATARSCWDSMCGASAAEPSADCFSGQFLCQHGATDCMMTRAWACTKAESGEVASQYMPFVTCTARHFLGVTTNDTLQRAIKTCRDEADLNRITWNGHDAAEAMWQCALGSGRGKSLLDAQGRLTVPHSGVPYVLVEGKELKDTGCVTCGDGVIQKVCEALRDKGLTGKEEIPVCAGIFGHI